MPRRRAGQATEIGLTLLALIVGAIMYMFLYRPFQQLDETASSQLSNQTALDGIGNTMTVFSTGLPLAFALISAIGLVMAALFAKRGGGRV